MKLKKLSLLGMMIVPLLAACGNVSDSSSNSLNEQKSENSMQNANESVQQSSNNSNPDLSDDMMVKNDKSEPINTFENLDLTDNEIYNKNGVVLSFNSIEFGAFTTASLREQFTINNQNPDNKKVSIRDMKVLVNGIAIQSNYGGHDEILGVTTGEPIDFYSSCSYDRQYDTILGFYGESRNTVPIKELRFIYDIQVGSNSESEKVDTVLKTSSYDGIGIEALFGDLVTTMTYENKHSVMETSNVYYREGDFGTTITVVNTNEAWGKVSSYEWYSEPNIYVNGNLYTKLSDDYRYLSDGKMYFINFKPTAEELRKHFEIPNSEPLSISIEICDCNSVVIEK